jgi:tRNA (guanine6-N2)-methyltransferase
VIHRRVPPNPGLPLRASDLQRAYEVEAIPGLEDFVERELLLRLRGAVQLRGRPAEGRILLSYQSDPRRLNRLRSAIAVSEVQTFDIPRPKSFLGHEHFARLQHLIQGVRELWPAGAFSTFRLAAAGSDSAVFARLKADLAESTGLTSAEPQADLLITIRRSPDHSPGWQVLVRLSPRPLSTRPWRVCNLPGALNATIASVMVGLAQPTPTERFLNLACGSATLLIERLAAAPAGLAVGIDLAEPALACARANLAASGYGGRAQLVQADARQLPLPSASFDTIVGDLPFGMLVGNAASNEQLYPALLAEAARVARPSARLVVITANRQLFERVLRDAAELWELEQTISVKVSFQSGYLTPAIYRCTRRPNG